MRLSLGRENNANTAVAYSTFFSCDWNSLSGKMGSGMLLYSVQSILRMMTAFI